MKTGVDILLTKVLPMGGGLGGGSSDAATVLVALNQLWELGLSMDELADLGLSLGADVPVFVRGRSAWAEGVGENLVPVDIPERWYLVVHPGSGVSTAEIFQHPELTRNSRPIKIPTLFQTGGTVEDFESFWASTGNDCEPIVRRGVPAVDLALRWLSHHGPARMTGTGACVFAPFATKQSAEQALAELPGGWWGMVARGVNLSPLFEGTGSALGVPVAAE